MKNFPNRENYTHLCLIFPMYGNRFTLFPNNYGRQQNLFSVATILSVMRFVFFISHQNILYSNKIKSPE